MLYETLIINSHTDQKMVKYMDILAFSIKKPPKTVQGFTSPAVFVYIGQLLWLLGSVMEKLCYGNLEILYFIVFLQTLKGWWQTQHVYLWWLHQRGKVLQLLWNHHTWSSDSIKWGFIRKRPINVSGGGGAERIQTHVSCLDYFTVL